MSSGKAFHKTQLNEPRSKQTLTPTQNARDIYELLLVASGTDSAARDSAATRARSFLEQQLGEAEQLPCDMPMDPLSLAPWMEQKASAVGSRYANYLKARKAGAPRSYFSCKSHALAFLQGVAPTKLVDGAWLYGTLQHWRDHRFHSLIRTYLEELGDGDPAHNHVVLYRRLLAENGCDSPIELSDEHYLQGAIQLALAHNAEDFLPEVIGYNLGYEQLPLHLLITAFELAEFDIDPYYFTVHVTVDNASSGHARKAVQSVLDCLPATGRTGQFLERVARGYRLNNLGIGSTDVIDGFNLDAEVVAMLERKGSFGKNLHSDYCRIAGRTVNEWLETPGQCADFLAALQSIGWIKRNEDPRNSRFWQLIDGPRAAMAGVFNGYEKQLLQDWIAGERIEGTKGSSTTMSMAGKDGARRRQSFRPYRSRTVITEADCRGLEVPEINELHRELESLSHQERMQQLIELLAPSSHPTPVGLFATREFAAALQQ
ncbi:iron-containing redox enzyme family protein [Proteobacteria bacterium 005FR1]|nr:iron-containing redox enzyme family protein [Proteobacteria bacterium 005FR1]